MYCDTSMMAMMASSSWKDGLSIELAHLAGQIGARRRREVVAKDRVVLVPEANVRFPDLTSLHPFMASSEFLRTLGLTSSIRMN